MGMGMRGQACDEHAGLQAGWDGRQWAGINFSGNLFGWWHFCDMCAVSNMLTCGVTVTVMTVTCFAFLLSSLCLAFWHFAFHLWPFTFLLKHFFLSVLPLPIGVKHLSLLPALTPFVDHLHCVAHPLLRWRRDLVVGLDGTWAKTLVALT